MKYYLKVIREYANFKGRASRKELEVFILFHLIFASAFMILGFVLKSDLLFKIYALIIFIPAFAVMVRRLHDVGKSGWYFCVALIPLVGGIWLLALLCSKGEIDFNKYGDSPNQQEVSLLLRQFHERLGEKIKDQN